jgi:hypothetical protein
MFAAIIGKNPASDFLPLRLRLTEKLEVIWQAVTWRGFNTTPKNYPCKDKKSTLFAAIDI